MLRDGRAAEKLRTRDGQYFFSDFSRSDVKPALRATRPSVSATCESLTLRSRRP